MIEVTAQMVASVLAVSVREGQQVASGDTLLIVESMKMEIPVAAPATGVVTGLPVTVGDTVHEGDLLAVVDPTKPATRAR